MIAHAEAKFPHGDWRVGDIRDLSNIERFDGVLSWDGFFHLTRAEQRSALPHIASRVKTGGALMLTVGWGDGEVTGTIAGETVYHASLSGDAYKAILRKAGFDHVTVKPGGENQTGRWIVLAYDKQ